MPPKSFAVWPMGVIYGIISRRFQTLKTTTVMPLDIEHVNKSKNTTVNTKNAVITYSYECSIKAKGSLVQYGRRCTIEAVNCLIDDMEDCEIYAKNCTIRNISRCTLSIQDNSILQTAKGSDIYTDGSCRISDLEECTTSRSGKLLRIKKMAHEETKLAVYNEKSLKCDVSCY